MKMMFNKRYGLEQAVLDGDKNMTRRLVRCPKDWNGIPVSGFRIAHNAVGDWFTYLVDEEEREITGSFLKCAYKIVVGQKVAIAQSYKDIEEAYINHEINEYPFSDFPNGEAPINSAGWTNKMFVKSCLMPHNIKITEVRLERLQYISDEDCLREGIREEERDAIGNRVIRFGFDDTQNPYGHWYNTPREAFAALIDKVSGKGTWDSNPWVVVYGFELIK